MATRMCDVCGIRPAVVTLRRLSLEKVRGSSTSVRSTLRRRGPGVRPSRADPRWERKPLRRLLRPVLRREPRDSPQGAGEDG